MDSIDKMPEESESLDNMEVSDIPTLSQDTDEPSEIVTPCQIADTHSKLVPANEDDLIFAKPFEVSSLKGKHKKSQDNLKADDTSALKSKDVYNEPQASSSKSDEEISAISLEINVEIPSPQGDKELSQINEDIHPQPSTSKKQDEILDDTCLKNSVDLYAPDSGPQMYQIKCDLVTPPIITKNLPQVFHYLPIYGKPGPNMKLKDFYRSKIREYVGCDLDDDDFSDLENYCSPEHMKTNRELKMETSVPVVGGLSSSVLHNNFSKPAMHNEPFNLVTLKKNKIRNVSDTKGLYLKKFKYRGVKILPFTQEENSDQSVLADTEDEVLVPGVDLLYRVRVYRPYSYSVNKWRLTRTRHSVFSCDIVLSGRHRLTDLRDRFVCHNDFDMRVDVSDHPDLMPTAKAKELFPSGFLFINNVFYVDTREGCIDYSAPIREWAIKRKIGDFPKKDMSEVRLQDLVIKLGYPEVYIHQGNCEHVFLFSEIRLVGPNDPLRMSRYPCSTAIAQNQTVYCTTCAEFSAKWIVVGSDRVPFDPGFFCDACFKLYMYKDGHKIGQFKAYRYRGNALNVLKP